MCFVFSVPSSWSENGNIRSPATFPSAMPFAANPFTGIRQTYIPPSLFQAHVHHFQQPPLLPSILQGSSNGSVSVVLTDAEVRAIFFNDPRDRQRQVLIKCLGIALLSAHVVHVSRCYLEYFMLKFQVYGYHEDEGLLLRGCSTYVRTQTVSRENHRFQICVCPRLKFMSLLTDS